MKIIFVTTGVTLIDLHTQLAALGIIGLAFIVVGANTLQDVRFGGRNFPFLKDDEVFVDNIVKSRQNALVCMTLVLIHVP